MNKAFITTATILLATFTVGAWVGVALGQSEQAPLPDITGIGGIFFKSDDPEATRAWYRDHLGISDQGEGANFFWLERDQPETLGLTVWSLFARDSDYFGTPAQEFMVNYRVRDMEALLARLEAAGIQQVKPREDYPFGRFAWIVDGDGRRIELWEPADPGAAQN